jgi:hypothetical protein
MRRCEVTGKIRYESERHAKIRTARVANRIRVYRCQWCKGLHVTDHEHGVEK